MTRITHETPPVRLDWRHHLTETTGILIAVILGLMLILSLVEPRFLAAQNLANLLRSASILAIISAGQMFVIIVRGFDLSVGATMAMVSVVTAMVMANVPEGTATSLTILYGVGAGFAAGAAVGLVNGLCVAYLKVHSFMVTLGTSSIVVGLALYLTNGIPVYGMPRGFSSEFGRAIWGGLPSAFYIGAGLALLFWVIQNLTTVGKYIYAVGGNFKSAVFSGLSANRYLVMAYVISGLTAALASILLTAQIGSGQGSIGGVLTFQSIAVAIIGGVSLQGGVGKIENVCLAALFLQLLTNAMELLRIQSQLQAVILGLIVILVAANDIRKTRSV
ncbi:ABC transporter permease [Ruegeria sp. Ofav3-42]|uniref:ABC transporter permease n=1 Tax=Ruegeria sp. Ofav3-42 TaxID=2917759 RepID=UPI001EF74884|nr:ABC transporter permease [Ruegeria sp. Ofav3-42]MCG7522446.1 ABC transporter permease [Ruegeria sp. Ofav3-42]